MNQTRLYWVCQLGGWTAYTGSGVMLSALFHPLTWASVAGSVLLGAFGLLYTHVYRALIHRWGWKHLPLAPLIPRVLGACVVIATALYITMAPIGRYLLELDAYPEMESELGLLLVSILNGSIIILLWSLIYFGVHAVWNHRRAEIDRWKMKAQMEATKLKALKLQLNPHFLFNSLNSVRSLISEDPSRAQHMVTRLARLLRTTLQGGDTTTVPLRDELDTVRVYLELEAVRFEDRLRYRIDVPDALLPCPVPFLIVQLLVENGIKHGIARRPSGGRVVVSARREDDLLCLRVENPGHLDPDVLTHGVGMQNARERLQLLFGDRATLTLHNHGAATVRAEIRLPLDAAPTSSRSASPQPTPLPAPSTTTD